MAEYSAHAEYTARLLRGAGRGMFWPVRTRSKRRVHGICRAWTRNPMRNTRLTSRVLPSLERRRGRWRNISTLFRRAPVVAIGERKRWSGSFLIVICGEWISCATARHVLSEVLSVGRSGSLVLAGEQGRTQLVWFRTENILNWKVERGRAGAALVELTLRDAGHVRVLKLLDSGCFQECWKVLADGNQQGESWTLEESGAVKRDGSALPFIPPSLQVF